MKMIKRIKTIIAARKRPVDPNEGAWAGYYGSLDTGLARLRSRDVTPSIRATSADHEWVERYLREEQASCSSED